MQEKKVPIQWKYSYMLNKKTNLCVLLLLIFCFLQGVSAQTTQWRVIWDRNSTEDNVDYYNVYRKIGSAATVNDPVLTQVPEPTAQNQDSVMFIDTHLQTATHYFYAIQAVDLQGSQSLLSLPASAAIPKILINDNMTFPVSTSIPLDLNQPQYVLDPDNSYSDLEWSVSGGQQITITINSSNIATVTTPQDSTGPETFVFTVVDPDSFFDTKTVSIFLSTAVNNPPLIHSDPITSAIVGELYEYNVIADDPDSDPLTFSLTQAPDFLSLSVVNNSMAKISGTPNINDVEDHLITVLVEDGNNGSDTQGYTLTVKESSNGGSFHSAVEVTNEQSSVVKISWIKIENTIDYIEYGLNQNYGNSSLMDNEYSTTHEKILTALIPASRYHFRIISEDQAGSIYQSTDFTFTTKEDDNEVRAFPIPYNVNNPTSDGGIYFDLPSSADSYSLLIYNMLGDLVFNISELTSSYVWKILNSAGKEVNAGLYLYYVKDNTGSQVASGKLVIVR